MNEVNLDTQEATHEEEQAALDLFAAIHSDVVRKIADGKAEQSDIQPLRDAKKEIDRLDNDILTQFAQRALSHVELAFKAMAEPDGRRKRRMTEKSRRKSENLSKFLRKVGVNVDDAEVAETT